MNQQPMTSSNGTVFSPSISGVTDFCEVNLRHHASAITVYAGSLGMFWVGAPRAARGAGRGIQAVAMGCETLGEAIELAATFVDKYEEKMNKIHALALKMDAKRG